MNRKTYIRFGIVVMVVAIAVLLYIFSNRLFGSHCTYFTILNDASGLRQSDRVMINNIDVGLVDRISFIGNDPQNGIAVRLKISKKVSIPQNSLASVRKEGLFDEKTVLCITLYGSETSLIPGDTILSEVALVRRISEYTEQYFELGIDSVAGMIMGMKEENKSAKYYTVQILVSTERLFDGDKRLRGHKGADFYLDEGLYKYIWGRFGNRSEALLARDSLVEQGFAGAFVIVMTNGKRLKK